MRRLSTIVGDTRIYYCLCKVHRFSESSITATRAKIAAGIRRCMALVCGLGLQTYPLGAVLKVLQTVALLRIPPQSHLPKSMVAAVVTSNHALSKVPVENALALRCGRFISHVGIVPLQRWLEQRLQSLWVGSANNSRVKIRGI